MQSQCECWNIKRPSASDVHVNWLRHILYLTGGTLSLLIIYVGVITYRKFT
jgi:hypothetical protein